MFMPRVKDHMATLIMGVGLLIYGLIVKTGVLLPLLKTLKVHKYMDLMVTLSLVVGAIAIVGALINSVKEPGDSIFDRFFLQPIGGIVMIRVLAMAIRWYLEPLVKMMSASLQPILGFKIYKVLNLNYVVLGILQQP